MAPKRKYLLDIPLEVEVALKHTAVARQQTIAATMLQAIVELVERNGWLARKALPQEPAAPMSTPGES